MSRMLRCFLLPLVFAIGPWPLHLSAQQSEQEVVVDANVARSSLLERIPSTSAHTQSGFATPSPGDDDLGEQLLLTRNERYRSLTFFGSVDEYFTTNAYLTNSYVRSDWYTAMQVGAIWLPHLAGNLYGEGTIRQQLFRYARFSELGFNSLDVGGGLIYVIRQLGDLSVSGRYNYNLLTNASSTSEIFHEQSLRFSLQKPFILSRAHFLYFGATAEIVLEGEPDFALRDRFYAFGGYQVSLTRSLSANLFYQIGYLDFRENNRSDWNQVLSASLVYNFTQWFAINTVISSSFNRSNEDFFNYDVFNVGFGVNGLIKF